MTPVTLFADKFARSWPTLDTEKPWREGDRGRVVTLTAALEHDYATDAHFAQYHSPEGRRLNHEVLGKRTSASGASAPTEDTAEVSLTCMIFDVDGPGHAADQSWRAGMREKMLAMFEAHGRGYYYETRGGCRFVFTQREPTVLESQDDAQEWSRLYLVACAYLQRRFGIEADPACSDWTRLFRVPYATRDAGGTPENWPSYGDLDDIAPLAIDATTADVQTAQARSARSFREPSNLEPGDYFGDGLLYWLLRNRGDVGRACNGGWIAHCPNRGEHSSDTDGSNTTLVFAPENGHELGTILCWHGHCDQKVNKDWLRYFSDGEIQAARIGAGIKKAS